MNHSILSETNSPGAERQLLVVRQDPGALGSYSTAIYIRDKGDSDLGERVFVAKGEHRVEVHWQNETQVVIAHDAKNEDIFVSALKSGHVAIEYEALKKIDFIESVRSLVKPQ